MYMLHSIIIYLFQENTDLYIPEMYILMLKSIFKRKTF